MMTHNTQKVWLVVAIITGMVMVCCAEEKAPKIGDGPDGNRSVPVHLMKIYDEQGTVISPGDPSPQPMSMGKSCGMCHDVEKISCGWHFNAAKKDVLSGRPSEPWLYVDVATATQLPLSYRSWPGAYQPADVGMSDWEFAKKFGRHTPGGLREDVNTSPDPKARWMVSGNLEVNCLACHDAEPGHDQAEYDMQINKENFLWAATATSAFARITGAAKDMPDTWDPVLGGEGDDPAKKPPKVEYLAHRFDGKGRVLFDLLREVPQERCLFCHSQKVTGTGKDHWETDGDVHLSSGLTCVDCHRNGLDHNITRGSETAKSLTCEGCHLGFDAKEQAPQTGRLGAPVPDHKGIPLVHFEKLACTACHSGPWPQAQTQGVKTSRTHELGLHNVKKGDAVLPQIEGPVYARMEDGKIAPNKLVWPAFWGVRDGEKIRPIKLDVVKSVLGNSLSDAQTRRERVWPKLTTEKIGTALKQFAGNSEIGGAPVYVAGGKVYTLDKDVVAAMEAPEAKPFLWAWGHNVRPAAQSLGVRGCDDCHTMKADFFFGQVVMGGPVEDDKANMMTMTHWQQIDPKYIKSFNWSFVFRPMLKVVCLLVCTLWLAILLLNGLKALACVSGWLGGKACTMAAAPVVYSEPRWLRFLIALGYLAGIGSFLVLAATGFYAYFRGEKLTQYALMIHATFGPVFAASWAFIALCRSARNRFTLTLGLATIKNLCFWLTLVLALPLVLSTVLSMFKLFGTTGQAFLYYTHQYTAAAIAVTILIYLGLAALLSRKTPHTQETA